MTAQPPRRLSLTVPLIAAVLALVAGLLAWHRIEAAATTPPPEPGAKRPTVAEATAFIEAAEKRLQELAIKFDRASWVQANFITQDTEKISADANEALIGAVTENALAARRYEGLDLPADVARKSALLKLAVELPAPNNAAERGELTEIAASLEGTYGRGKYCPPAAAAAPAGGGAEGSGDGCLDINAITKIMADSRDPNRLLDVWRGWHTISPPMRPKYQRFVELANKGAREMGFKDLGAMWRSGYDMPPDAFSAEVERLWKQVAPLYWSLHAYMRTQLGRQYGAQTVPPDGPIPAHLLGNMWAQSWSNVYPLVAPPAADPATAAAGSRRRSTSRVPARRRDRRRREGDRAACRPRRERTCDTCNAARPRHAGRGRSRACGARALPCRGRTARRAWRG